MAGQHQLILFQRVAGGVQAGKQALGGSFLVARGSVELSRAINARGHLAFQRRL